MKFYAACKPPMAVCFSFDIKKLRDEWVTEMNKRDKARCFKHLSEAGCSEQEIEKVYEENFYSLTKSEALKKFGYTDSCSNRVVWVHRHINDVNDRW